ncbi:MAG: 50S ribosomal protein L25 [Clostridia bacterium]|nr:50S ribosomal protein L25 [Clostridia bacterium]
MSNDHLKATVRKKVGKNAVKQVRQERFIPGVLYGHHIESINLKIDEKEFEKFHKKHDPGASLTIDLDGTPHFVLFKDMQVDLLRHETLHVEFQALSKGEKIKVKVPIHYHGKEKIPAGIVFQELHHEVVMHVLPKDIIESIDIDVSKVQLGSRVTVGELDIYKDGKHEIMDDPELLLFTLSEPSVMLETDEDELEATEVPEIGKEE